jgi:hypothetical protein
MTDAIYFTDAAGVRYRVLDARMAKGVWAFANPPAPWATCRIFRPKEGMRRLYYFKPGEPRAPDGAELERQLRVAEYLPAQKYQAPKMDPR